jgi:predicted PurR-regulated permease PerM
MTRLISLAVLIAIIIVFGSMFYSVMVGFFVPLFLAAVLVVVFRPLHLWVLAKTRQRQHLSAAITTLLIVLSVLLPFGLIATIASVQGLKLVSNVSPSSIRIGLSRLRDSLGMRMEHEVRIREAQAEVLGIMRQADATVLPAENREVQKLGRSAKITFTALRDDVRLNEGTKFDERFAHLIDLADRIMQPAEAELSLQQTAVDLSTSFEELRTQLLGGPYLAFAKELTNPTAAEIQQLTEQGVNYIKPRLLTYTGATGSFFVRAIFGGVILLLATFFFLSDGPGMVQTIMHLSPLDKRYEEELLHEFDRISRAVVLATLLSALAQGLTAGIGYYFAGAHSLPLLIMLTTMFALVPFVGPAVVWIPVCCYLAFFKDQTTAAIGLACWGVLVVGTIDNFVKAFVLHGQSQLHPLLALLSVLGGVQALGPVGIVVGPMIIALLQTLLSILQRELLSFEASDQGALIDQLAGASNSGATPVTSQPAAVATSNTEPVATNAPPIPTKRKRTKKS